MGKLPTQPGRRRCRSPLPRLLPVSGCRGGVGGRSRRAVGRAAPAWRSSGAPGRRARPRGLPAPPPRAAAARRPVTRRLAGLGAPRGRRRLPPRAASPSCGGTRPSPPRPPAPASTSSSPPARRPGSRSPTSCPRSPRSSNAGGTRGERGASTLYISPTKALAQDQLASIAGLGLDVRVTTHDGDSSYDERDWTREHGEYVLTNPDMLHRSLLPRHDRWAGSSARSTWSWSTSATTTAASSAPTSPRCCAGCAGCAPTTAPTRRSSSPRRPSATRPSTPLASPASTCWP